MLEREQGFAIMIVIFTNVYLVSFHHRACERIRGKLGKVKTTAEELESGIPPKFMFTQDEKVFLRWYIYIFLIGMIRFCNIYKDNPNAKLVDRFWVLI